MRFGILLKYRERERDREGKRNRKKEFIVCSKIREKEGENVSPSQK